jgi:hypothetical protein
MDGVNVPDASGAVCVCGKCNVPMELHPHQWCPYEYEAVREKGKIIAYFMLAKKEEQKNGLRKSKKAS